jgi:hypothetical protein
LLNDRRIRIRIQEAQKYTELRIHCYEVLLIINYIQKSLGPISLLYKIKITSVQGSEVLSSALVAVTSTFPGRAPALASEVCSYCTVCPYISPSIPMTTLHILHVSWCLRGLYAKTCCCIINQLTLIKKKTKFPHIKGNSEGSGAKSYMRQGFIIYE